MSDAGQWLIAENGQALEDGRASHVGDQRQTFGLWRAPPGRKGCSDTALWFRARSVHHHRARLGDIKGGHPEHVLLAMLA